MVDWRNGRVLSCLRGCAMAATLFSLQACSGMDFDFPQPADYPVHGIDVSYYQGEIDWDGVRRSGTAFAYIKATEGGDHIDSAFRRNWDAAAAAGVPRGAYHFWYFCRPVQDQIAWFMLNVPVDPNALPPVLDMEWNNESKTCRTRPPRDQLLAEIRTFMTEIERFYGKRPVIYTSVDFHRDILAGELDDHLFWLRSVAGHPQTRYGDRRWTFWQYTAEGRVGGISGNVDRNAFVGTHEEWAAFRRGETRLASNTP